MFQIRIHGRGGQGVVTAAELIAIAAFKDGKIAQAFPYFGVERTGAPIEAYARLSDQVIQTRERVYNPDILIIVDSTLIGTLDMTSDCDRNTKIVINSAQDKKDIKINFPKENIFTIDATKIALEIFGKNLSNTVILGAFAKDTGLITLKGLEAAIREKFADKGKEIIEKNIKAIDKAYNN
ncbi:MAG: 2-oxoacid:acceptor oxidoreductase family protein [Patescibacteria group bacterium]|nr:2-oxoacid:acceptor oxidoreductase family protein [Patescibacteria group bacterium]MDD4610760.1 2-oxoacid:acceptor oxidoreductase family protein [Patescibacteria group bacterium]